MYFDWKLTGINERMVSEMCTVFCCFDLTQQKVMGGFLTGGKAPKMPKAQSASLTSLNEAICSQPVNPPLS